MAEESPCSEDHRYYVRATENLQEDGERFGPLKDRQTAEQLLVVLAGKANVKRATLEVEVIP